jgi:hypothetical protein
MAGQRRCLSPSYICVLKLLYMCPHTTTYVVLILLYMCPSYYYVCVLILLYMCPHTTTYVVLILLYMCPHATIYVSSYYYICGPHTTIYVSSYYYICVPHTTIYVSSDYLWPANDDAYRRAIYEGERPDSVKINDSVKSIITSSLAKIQVRILSLLTLPVQQYQFTWVPSTKVRMLTT